MPYYKISIAKTGIDMRDHGNGAHIDYIIAPDHWTAEQHAEDQAEAYGCTQSSYKFVLYEELPDDIDKSSIPEIK